MASETRHSELVEWADNIDSIKAVKIDFTTQARLTIPNDLSWNQWKELNKMGYIVGGVRNNGEWVYVDKFSP